MSKTEIPSIRFRGFGDAWEQRKLGDVVKEIIRNDPESEAPIMMITANNGFIEQSERYAFNNAGESLKKYILLKKGELAYNHGASKLRPYGSCFALTTAENARIPFVYHCFSAENQNAEFMSIELNGAEIENQLRKIVSSGARMDGLLNISFDEYTSVSVLLPGTEEQDRIADFFRHLDNLITLHQRKFEKLTNVKKSMLEKMFPRNGSCYPEIRFKGFTDLWEQRKFGEITSKYEDPVPTPHDGYYRLGIRSHAKGTFHSYVVKGQELETAQMHRVAAGNFIVNITFGWEHAVAITDKNDAGKLVSHRFPQFSFAEGMVPEFFRYVIVDEKFRHHLWLASPGGAGRNRVLKLDEMLNYLMRFPSRDEQIKIAEFFRQLDNLITLHQRELEKLQSTKKALLEKMFV